MQAQRIVTQVDSSGHLMQLPLLPPGQSVEVIVLLLEGGTQSKPRRKVPAHLKGKIREVGDIMSSAPLSDWGNRTHRPSGRFFSGTSQRSPGQTDLLHPPYFTIRQS